MSKEQYFTILQDEDGARFRSFDTLEDVQVHFGIDDPVEDFAVGCHPAERFRRTVDELRSRSGIVLIKGRVLLPEKKEIVTKWELEE